MQGRPVAEGRLVTKTKSHYESEDHEFRFIFDFLPASRNEAKQKERSSEWLRGVS